MLFTLPCQITNAVRNKGSSEGRSLLVLRNKQSTNQGSEERSFTEQRKFILAIQNKLPLFSLRPILVWVFTRWFSPRENLTTNKVSSLVNTKGVLPKVEPLLGMVTNKVRNISSLPCLLVLTNR